MINRIKQFFDTKLATDSKTTKAQSEHSSRLAVAALMLEVAESDYKDQPEEKAMLVELSKKSFALDENGANELVELAQKEHTDSTDYFQFTSLINKSYDETQKIKLIENLWEIAYADNELHKYEEHVIRRIADLIYVSHKDFIATKHRVQNRK
ncbi:MAG TPA: TerB family tellurite resistance protein [Leucothrix mucor]|nr:TerB family tellurite resistance protein [Leucothrix mucor]